MPPDDHHGQPGRDESLDDLFTALAHDRRRHVLEYLLEGDDDVADLDELARRVASRNRRSDEVQEVAIGLHHADLPKLASTGVVEYDPRSKVARYRGDERLETIWEVALAGEPGQDAASSRDR